MTTRWFEDYSAFLESSETGSTLNRLNLRYEALIAANVEHVEGRSILDIASHDGRWSFAAIKNGARHVLGIEGRPHLVENAKKNMTRYGVPESAYTFIVGDVHDRMREIEPGTIDTVFLFGFLYHTIHHVGLLSSIRRLEPKCLIVDTAVWPNVPVASIYGPDSPYVRGEAPGSNNDYLPLIRVETESGQFEGEAIGQDTVVGYPNKAALELMLRYTGFSEIAYHDWHDKGIRDWQGVLDYKQHVRVTVVARPRRAGA